MAACCACPAATLSRKQLPGCLHDADRSPAPTHIERGAPAAAQPPSTWALGLDRPAPQQGGGAHPSGTSPRREPAAGMCGPIGERCRAMAPQTLPHRAPAGLPGLLIDSDDHGAACWGRQKGWVEAPESPPSCRRPAAADALPSLFPPRPSLRPLQAPPSGWDSPSSRCCSSPSWPASSAAAIPMRVRVDPQPLLSPTCEPAAVALRCPAPLSTAPPCMPSPTTTTPCRRVV